jgi:hypothetical protein
MNNINILSPIQNRILRTLKNESSLRYSDIQFKDVPNDLFNYHLQFLVKKGFLNKAKDGYSLSEFGVKYMADPFTKPEKPDSAGLFKLNVITIVSRIHNKEIQILNQLRTSHPSFGKVGVMGGVVRKGESIEDAANRKLQVETGLEASFKLIGMERRLMYVKDELFADMLFPITYSDECYGEILEETAYGKNMWVPIDKAIENESDPFDSIVGITTVLKAIKDGSVHRMPMFVTESVRKGDKMP